MKTTDRRSFLQTGLGGLAGLASVPLLSGLAGCQTLASGQAAGSTTATAGSAAKTAGRKAALSTEKLTERVTLLAGAPGNVIALAADDGIVLVDSGAVGFRARGQSQSCRLEGAHALQHALSRRSDRRE